MERQFLQQLVKKARRRPIWIPANGAFRQQMGREQIEHVLPHRDPFLLLDEITDIDLEGQVIRGRTRISANDRVFAGHFPGNPIYPGVLQLEMVGQLGLCLIHFVRANSTQIDADTNPADIRALKVHFAEFLAPVKPEDDLTIVSHIVDANDYTFICEGQILKADTVCSCGVMEVYLVDG